MRQYLFGALLAVGLFGAAPAFADEQRELALATQVVEDAGLRAQVLQGMEMVMPMAREQLRTRAPGMDADRFIVLFREEIDRMMPSMLADIAKTYADQFTEEELTQLAAFFRSPGGRALVAKQPALTDKLAAVGRQYGAQAGLAAATRLLAAGTATPPANP
jgi:uncharacterized protein